MRVASTIGMITLTMLLAACGGSDKPAAAPEATDTTATAPAAEPTAPAAEPAPAAMPATATPTGGAVTFASLTGDAAKGEKVFGQCRSCHVTDPGVNRVGPSLHAVVGRKAGTIAGFNYSSANRNSGVTWNEETLFQYLEAPQKFMPGTRMAFAGLKNPQDRADVIAYLKTKA